MVEIRVIVKPEKEETKLHKIPDSFDLFKSLFINSDNNDVLEISDLLPVMCIYKPDLPGTFIENDDQDKLDRKVLKKARFISEKALSKINITKFYISLYSKYKSGEIIIDSSNKIILSAEESIEYKIGEKIRPVWYSTARCGTNQICYFPSKDTTFQFFVRLSEGKLEKIKDKNVIEVCNGRFKIQSVDQLKSKHTNKAILLSSYSPKDVVVFVN